MLSQEISRFARNDNSDFRRGEANSGILIKPVIPNEAQRNEESRKPGKDNNEFF
jgi:hypothetical protein